MVGIAIEWYVRNDKIARLGGFVQHKIRGIR
jgi:hypothetical protein